ncbi:aldehyde dehydrogenase family protein [Nocardioides daeguensis]|uniref:Aldehyde dehydrogenase n=1 Tax=Nocardioides daeguensis TaxID=908359 RepID=A0ABP6W7E1_9ACTN|nr:aldehyde dehydrogenase family protein [Nocardioides daeguensis]MBV6729344.1 aldehyde dehydrogenase family protein [Nocardioides daeguensis]MCR1774320.1 aldehyde dehydrogenase family protein [Nocardioides daeguensis]
MTSTDAAPTAPAAQTFTSLDPATGAVVGTHPIHTAADVQAAVATARKQSEWWQALGFEGRKKALVRWRKVIARRMEELAALMARETGKPDGDALMETALAVDHLSWAASHAEKVLKRRSVSPGLLMVNQAASVEYRPLGVVGVIGPWNYPVFTPMGSIAYALAAGNAVVFKPSEYTPGVGEWLAETFREAVGRPVLQVVTGYGETGAALTAAGVDKVAFTGSTATGKRVMASCAETLTPVVIEAGGKDALIVAEDADVAEAAEAALWGAVANAGQTCAGVERVYVHDRVYDQFLDELVAQAKQLEARPGGQVGPITMPSQVDIIRRHVDDALARGGRALVGGPVPEGARFVQPTVLVDVPEDSAAVQEETFGPTVTVSRVRTMDEAIERANGTRYALGSTVFSKEHGMEIAQRLRAGMTAINGVISFAGIPTLPFGGVGDSGFGRIHGPDGLREFTYPHAIARQRFKPAIALTTFRRTAKEEKQLTKVVRGLYGRGKN